MKSHLCFLICLLVWSGLDKTAHFTLASMGWQDWARLAISTLIAISHGLKTALLAVLHLLFYLVILATYPISWVWATLLFILTPVTHTIR